MFNSSIQQLMDSGIPMGDRGYRKDPPGRFYHALQVACYPFRRCPAGSQPEDRWTAARHQYAFKTGVSQQTPCPVDLGMGRPHRRFQVVMQTGRQFLDIPSPQDRNN
jgi:hypothetical protein